jgi:YggT family protein
MSENRQINEVAVDRREETVSTRQPGYAATEQVTRDAAAEQRLGMDQVNRIILAILGIVEIGLGLRFVLKLIAANAGSGFADFIYGITGPFIAPFAGLVGTPAAGGVVLEVTTLIAMAVYALLVWIILQGVSIAMARTSSRTSTRSTSEQIGAAGAGTQRTTHTNTSG